MEFEEYKQVVTGRYQNLTPEEKTLVDGVFETPAGSLILGLLGQELVAPTQESAPTEAPAPQQQEQQPVRVGLGAR